MIKVLQKYKYKEKSYLALGLGLGLSYNTLTAIEQNNRGDVSRCLTECLRAWLRKADQVESKGEPTWETLIAALKHAGDTDVADEIERNSK